MTNIASLFQVPLRFVRAVQGYQKDSDRNYTQGVIEVSHNGAWGAICDTNFNNNNAYVLCRMMGYESGAYNATYKQSNVSKSNNIWLDELQCNGTETDVEQCLHRGWGVHNCTHADDVSVRCYGKILVINFLRNLSFL